MSDHHPLDWASLEKDSSVPQSKIEDIYQVKAGDDPESYRLAQMKLVELIERNRTDLYPRISRYDIRLMNDREAEEYNGGRHRAHVRAIARDARRRGRIDRSGFDDAERRAAESRDLGYSALALMAQRALRKSEREAALFLGSGDETTEEVY